jgi:hypothetical protein
MEDLESQIQEITLFNGIRDKYKIYPKTIDEYKHKGVLELGL